MAVAGTVAVLILCLALACNVDAGTRVRPVSGPDIYQGQNIAKDVIVPGEKIVNVLTFKAKPDGKKDSTQAFMDAWREVCHSPGVVRLLVPLGNFLVGPMYFAGPCTSKAITIQVVGTILATTDPSDYVNGEWLIFEDLAGIKLIGGGTFDGQGQLLWPYSKDCDKDPSSDLCSRLPSSIQFNRVNNAVIQNIKSVNAKGFHIFITNSANIRLRKLHITAPADSPNTDGIHISHSIRIRISKSVIATGDDCVSMIQGTNDVAINRVKCGPGHGFSIGSLGKYPDELEVRNIRVLSSSLTGTTNGLRIKAWPNKYPGLAADIFFTDITMQDVQNPIIIDEEYECKPECKEKPSLVKISNVHFSNIRGTTPSPLAVNIICSKQIPCENIILRDIDLKLGAAPTMAKCSNTKPIYLGLQNPPACL